MRCENSVNQYFKYFNIDNDEACIHKNVKHSCNWTLHHFTLSKRNKNHGLPSLRFSVVPVLGFAKLNVPRNLSYILCKKNNGGNKKKRENYLTCQNVSLITA